MRECFAAPEIMFSARNTLLWRNFLNLIVNSYQLHFWHSREVAVCFLPTGADSQKLASATSGSNSWPNWEHQPYNAETLMLTKQTRGKNHIKTTQIPYPPRLPNSKQQQNLWHLDFQASTRLGIYLPITKLSKKRAGSTTLWAQDFLNYKKLLPCSYFCTKIASRPMLSWSKTMIRRAAKLSYHAHGD